VKKVFIDSGAFIETVWGTDHHLGLEGATVVPGSRPV